MTVDLYINLLVIACEALASTLLVMSPWRTVSRGGSETPFFPASGSGSEVP